MGAPFGERVHRARVQRGWTQEELAARAGISVRTLRDVEHGRAEHLRPALRTCLAAALDLRRTERPSAPALWVGVLGPLVIHGGGVPLKPGQGHHLTLLGLLAVHAGDPVGHDEIVHVLWGARPPTSWRRMLNTYAGRLDRLLHPHAGRPVLLPARAGRQLALDERQLDVIAFRRHGSDQGSRAEALRLWRGDVLADLSDRLANHPLAHALRRQRVTTALSFAERAPAQDAVAVLEPIAQLDPLNESVQARLMSALAATGEQAAAFAVFDRVRRRLDGDLGVQPGDELRAAHARLLHMSTPAADPSGTPAQLPAGVTAFTGRAAELVALDALLPRTATGRTAAAIAVISGSGGVGKTALAVHWAHRVRHLFPDGQLYADLHGYGPDQPADIREVLARFLRALGVDTQAIPDGVAECSAKFRSLLAGRRMLLLLDNARTAGQVRALLPGTGTTAVVVTSRDALRGLIARDGALRTALGTLDRSDSHALLRSLLGKRATTDPAATAELVTQCAGLPLALRLAADLAARRAAVPLRELVSELTDQQHRLDSLGVPGDDRASLRQVFAWSYEALAPDAARLFRHLGAHPGPDTDVHGAAVLGDTDTGRAQLLLDQLCGAHLLDEHKYGRYRSHDLLRAYALRLSTQDGPEALDRLIGHHLHTAHRAEHQLDPGYREITPPLPPASPDTRPRAFPDNDAAMRWFAAEHDTLHALINTCRARDDHTRVIHLALSMRTFHFRACLWTCYRTSFEPAIRAATELGETATASLCHGILAFGEAHLGHHDDALRHGLRALDLATGVDDVDLITRAHRCIAWTHSNNGEHAKALIHCNHALRLAQRLGDLVLESDLLNGIGWQYTKLGDHQRALDACRRAYDVAVRSGNDGSGCAALEDLGVAHLNLGDNGEAVRILTRAADWFSALGVRSGIITTYTHLGDAHHALCDDHSARSAWQTAVDTIDNPSDPRATTLLAKITGTNGSAAGRRADPPVARRMPHRSPGGRPAG